MHIRFLQNMRRIRVSACTRYYSPCANATCCYLEDIHALMTLRVVNLPPQELSENNCSSKSNPWETSQCAALRRCYPSPDFQMHCPHALCTPKPLIEICHAR